MVAAALEHVEEAGQVGIRIGIRIDQRMPHAGLCGEMHHVRKPVRREQVGHRRAIRQIDLLEAEVRAVGGKIFEPRLLQPGIVVGVEIVEANHAVAIRQQTLADVHADKAGSAGDENGFTRHSLFPL